MIRALTLVIALYVVGDTLTASFDLPVPGAAIGVLAQF
jgi:putative effector of murein hydrolase LrgA (UPF0299 family)